MIINHNIQALNTYRQFGAANAAQSKSMEKLSSGLRINRAGDDAAGLAISEKMRAQVRGLDQAATNAQDGISLIQTAEGALTETHAILQRMRELATQAANDTYTKEDRGEIQKEINQLTSEINRIGNTTEFNTKTLLNGSLDSAQKAKYASVGTVTAADGTDPAKVTLTLTELPKVGDKVKITIDGEEEVYEFVADNATGNQISLKDVEDFDDLTIAGATGDADGKFEITTGTTVDADTTLSVSVTSGKDVQFQIGANTGQSFTAKIEDMRSEALKISTTDNANAAASNAKWTASTVVSNGTDNDSVEYALDVTTHENATAAITVINDAILSVSAQRSTLGAYQNRLEHTINNLGAASENLTAAESRIRDVDMAKEMMEQTKQSILSQASQAMLAQANQNPQNVLQLLR